jgi:hypothetical protein
MGILIQDEINALKAQLSAAVEAKTRAEGEAAAMRRVLSLIQATNSGMCHGDECPARNHPNGDCGCPDEGAIYDERPCVDGECECTLFTDDIYHALAPTAGSALLEEMKRKDETIKTLTGELAALALGVGLAGQLSRAENRRRLAEVRQQKAEEQRDAARAEVERLTRERAGVDEAIRVLYGRHRELATKRILGTATADEAAELESVREDIDIAEAYEQIDNLSGIVNGKATALGNALAEARADLERVTRERDEARAERDDEALEVAKARAALDEERKAHQLTRDGIDMVHKACATAHARREQAERERDRYLFDHDQRTYQIEQALQEARPWIESGLPPDRGHSCGPESGACDGDCMTLAYGVKLIARIDALLAPGPTASETAKCGDDAPRAECSWCGRKTWSSVREGDLCNFPKPVGGVCHGVWVLAQPPRADGGGKEGA